MQTLQTVTYKTEYLVVGAGAAGCTLGYLLKKAGADVFLLEMQNAQQRFKLCAGILENRAGAAFHDIFGETVEEAGLAPMSLDVFALRYGGYELRRALPRGSEVGNVMVGARNAAAENASFRNDDRKTAIWNTGAGNGEQGIRSLGSSFRNYFKAGGKALAKKMILEALGFDLARDLNFRALPRKGLDDYIRDRYLAEGGEIRYHAKVLSIKEEDGLAECVDLATGERFAVRFQYIIGADGAMSSVRRLLTGRQQRVYLALEAAVPLVRRETVGSLVKDGLGYCWYIPRGEDATVGCGYHYQGREDAAGGVGYNNSGREDVAKRSGFHGLGGNVASEGRGYHNSDTRAYEVCRQRLTAFCADLGVAVPPRFYGAFIPEGDDVLLRPGKRSFLIGDAAGLNDAFTGGGIHYALLSAQALATSLVGNGYSAAQLSGNAVNAACSGKVSYEDAMRPHLAFIKKNVDNVGLYYRVACNVVERFGKKRIKERAVKILE